MYMSPHMRKSFTGVDLVKPSTIYYNSAELMKGLPGRPKETNKVNASQSKVRESSSSEDRLSVSSTPSTPVMSSKLKSPKHSFPSVSSRQDSLSGELVDTARLVAIEERIDVSQSVRIDRMDIHIYSICTAMKPQYELGMAIMGKNCINF